MRRWVTALLSTPMPTSTGAIESWVIQLVVIALRSSPARLPTRARAFGIFQVTRLSSSSSRAMAPGYEHVVADRPLGRPRAARGSGRAGGDPAQGRFGLRRVATRRERGEQLGGGVGHLADRPLEGLLGGRRGGLHPADLADVLAGGGVDLLGGDRRLEPPQGGDVAAHGGAPSTG